MLERDTTVLLVVDFQERLLPKITNADKIICQASALIRFARLLKIPILLTEQYRKGLGPTHPNVLAALEDVPPIEKMAFSCFGEGRFVDALAATSRRQLLVVGVETHVCVLQTVLDALKRDLEVFVVQDALGSRAVAQRDAGLARMRQRGADIVTVEMAVFELLRQAGTEDFRAALPLIKEIAKE